MDWIPGEGTTEFSFDLRENHSLGLSILAVRELAKTNSGNYFTQLSASMKDDGENNDYHGNQDERIILNAGFGTQLAAGAYEANNLCQMWAEEPVVTATIQ